MAKERVEVSLQIMRLLTLGSEKRDCHKGHLTKRTVLVKTPLTVGSQGSPDRTLGPLSSRTHVVHRSSHTSATMNISVIWRKLEDYS